MSIADGRKHPRIKNTVFNKEDSLTIREKQEELRKFLSKVLGVKITPSNINYYLNRHENLKSKGLL